MESNYVLIDYENVQPEALATLNVEHFKVKVFIGAGQKKLSTEMFLAMQEMGGKAEGIRISGNGPNALDFHIAFYIGQLATNDPTAQFHIISKDTGFDPLIDHLKSKGISVKRSRDVKTVVPAKKTRTATAKVSADRLQMVLKNLRQRGAAKPTTVQKLRGTINGLFQKKLSVQEIDALLAELESRALVSIDGTKVSYSLD